MNGYLQSKESPFKMASILNNIQDDTIRISDRDIIFLIIAISASVKPFHLCCLKPKRYKLSSRKYDET